MMVTKAVFRNKKQKPTLSYHVKILILLVLSVIVLSSIWKTISRTILPSNDKKGIASRKPKDLPPWKEGFLDIHHIHAGVNVATFAIFPDGTTMLIDCRDLDIKAFQKIYGKRTKLYPALDVVSPYPNGSKTTGQWVIDYINHFWPNKQANTGDRKSIDYMMITHFHQDHIGTIYTNGNQANGIRGDYIRTGIVEVGDEVDFRTIIDRGYPKYDFPFDLENDWESAPFSNYLKFIRTSLQRGSTEAIEKFQVGSYTQIGLRKATETKRFGHFVVRNIKANLEYSYALPNKETVMKIDGQLLTAAPKRKAGFTYDENKLSTAIVIEYGKFKYYEGGDQEYHNNGYPWELPDGETYDLDTVTPTAQVAGQVHVATLNHHGHGVLKAFCDMINPKVMILQGWCTDQPPDHSMETLRDSFGSSRDLFATYVSGERLKDLDSVRHMFTSTVGHVVVRVEPPPISGVQNYHVYVLDGNREVDKYFGPYKAD
jgi:ribonuclease BN (tRNA processing enzyme)